MDWQSARWIWLEDDGKITCTHVIFQRDFRLDELPSRASLSLTADTHYRLRINGQWCADGPARCCAENCSFDILNCAHLLRCGLNRLEIEVHLTKARQRGGLLACLEWQTPDGPREYLCSDNSWRAAAMPQYTSQVLSLSETSFLPELFDNSGDTVPEFRPAAIVCDPEAGPWKGLSPRGVPLLTRREALIRRVEEISAVDREFQVLLLPGNEKTVCAARITLNAAEELPLFSDGAFVQVNGRAAGEDPAVLHPGENFIFWENTAGGGSFAIALPPEADLSSAAFFKAVPSPEADHTVPTDMAAFQTQFPQAVGLALQDFFSDAGALSFLLRSPQNLPSAAVEGPQALIYPDDRCTIVHPVENKDIELFCELEAPNTGFWNFVLHAPAGTVVDLTTTDSQNVPTGQIRHICTGGWNRFTTHTRCCGKGVFLTLRRMTGDVHIQSLRLVESTYPVIPCGEFRSSDRELDRLYRNSLQELKLSMLDILTDHPNISAVTAPVLYQKMSAALAVFGAWDLLKYTLNLTGEILSRNSGRQKFIHGFFWIFALLVFYRETGDKDFIYSQLPRLKQLLAESEQQTDPATGLFKSSGKVCFPELSETENIPFILTDTFLYKGALDRAAELFTLAEDPSLSTGEQIGFLLRGLNRQWDERHLSYADQPESCDEKMQTQNFSVHTSMLSLLFDIIPDALRASACANTISPRSGLKNVCSPPAQHLWYETLEKLEQSEDLLSALRKENSASLLWFLPRLVLGLTTEDGGRTFVVSPWITHLEYASGTRASLRGPVHVSWFRAAEKEIVINASAPPEVELVFKENLSLRDHTVKFNRIRGKKC